MSKLSASSRSMKHQRPSTASSWANFASLHVTPEISSLLTGNPPPSQHGAGVAPARQLADHSPAAPPTTSDGSLSSAARDFADTFMRQSVSPPHSVNQDQVQAMLDAVAHSSEASRQTTDLEGIASAIMSTKTPGFLMCGENCDKVHRVHCLA